jgi:hypothetical protein
MLAREIRIEVERPFEVSVCEGFDYITEPANWPAYWPRFVRLDPASRWRDRGDRARVTLRSSGPAAGRQQILVAPAQLPQPGGHCTRCVSPPARIVPFRQA